MNLLTPPSSSHRADKEKENKFPAPVAGPSTRSVVWAPQNSIHCLGTPPKPTTISSRNRPDATKSILKKVSQNSMLEVPPAPQKRATTPEPSDPLVDLNYLDRPVAKILSNGESNSTESLSELIEGYNVLAARLRASVSDSTDADASWPLFQPLRKNTQAFVDAIVRDLGRALVDPLSQHFGAEQEEHASTPKFTLPSPQKSPMKKKDGMTAEQAKYARDLCIISHSVIKLLSVILSVSAIYSVFENKQLGQILTATLAIPLAEELPTPNARKTCALAIWLIQVQRLPSVVLQPAADRIAYALRRGLAGELGKEGKKGSASDGLKAIHDLCVYLPTVFTPAFLPLLPSVLSNLLANTLTLRTQACHALGGFVIGSTSIPLSTIHTQLANTVAAFITTVPSPNTTSPTKPTEAAIVRTLRTTIGSVEPAHVAQGPVWAISVLASFVVLLRSKLCADAKVNRVISSLLGLAMRHKKSSVRALCCISWRTITWSYFQPPLPPQNEDGDNEEDQGLLDQVKKIHCKVMMSVVEMQAGISTIAALLGEENTDDEPLRLALQILDNMTTRGGHPCTDAMDALRHMTSIANTDHEEVEPWDLHLLLPKGLFSANPGLLTTEFKNLCAAVRPIFDDLAQTPDIRLLTREELSKEWVFNGLLTAWRNALWQLEMFDEAAVPQNVVEIWSNLLKAKVGLLKETNDDQGISDLAESAVKYLVEIVQDSSLDLRPNKSPGKPSIDTTQAQEPTSPDSDDTIPDTGISTWTNGELRLKIVGRLWAAMKAHVPRQLLDKAGDLLIEALVLSQMSLVPENARFTSCFDEEDGDRARNSWLGLCLDVLQVCDVNMFKMFWGVETENHVKASPWVWNNDFTRAIWRASLEKWTEMEGYWQAGVVLLGIPFSDRHAWNPTGEDYDAWEDMLNHITAQDPDEGTDAINVLDMVARFVSHFQTPGLNSGSSLRLIDLIISHFEPAKMREIPSNIIELAASTMRATYPPEPRNTAVSMWMIRSLSTLIENCPAMFCPKLFEALDEGLCLWLGDECGVWSENEMNYDIIPLYQHILVKIQTMPENLATLAKLENILDSVFVNRVPPSLVESFIDYWKLTYGRMDVPQGGWSPVIKHCLRAVGLLPPPTELEIALSNTLGSAFVAYPSSPRTPVSASFSTPPSAITKREALSRVASPQRPKKVFASFPIVPSTPLSPLRRRSSSSSTSTTRTPLSAIQLCSSPTKRRRLMASDGENKEGKENTLGGGVITSVMDRIIELKPNGKKRRYDDGEADDQLTHEPPSSSSKKLKGKMKPKGKPVAKKARFPSPSPAPSAASASSNESEDERWVERTLTSGLPFPKINASAECSEVFSEEVLDTARRLRGDRIVVSRATIVYASTSRNTPKESERATATSLDAHVTAPVTSRKIDLSKLPIRRSTSIPDSLLASIANRKRKRRDSDTDSSGSEPDEDLYATNTTDPIPALSIQARPRHFKKAFTIPSSNSDSSMATTPLPMSSDDDPHIGQVTPHHLISPALIRRPGGDGKISISKMSILKELFGDSPIGSDDSMSSDAPDSESPTKDLMSRQLQRQGSRTLPAIGSVSQ